MDIINKAKIVSNAIVLATLALEEQIQTASPVQLLFYTSINAFLLAQIDIINQAKSATNAIVLATLALEGQIQTVSPALHLSNFSLNIDVLLHVRMDSQKMLQILVTSAKNLLPKDANLAIQHARLVLPFRYPQIQINVYFVILLASSLVVNVFVEILKMSG